MGHGYLPGSAPCTCGHTRARHDRHSEQSSCLAGWGNATTMRVGCRCQSFTLDVEADVAAQRQETLDDDEDTAGAGPQTTEKENRDPLTEVPPAPPSGATSNAPLGVAGAGPQTTPTDGGPA